jgi:hypothetical protein
MSSDPSEKIPAEDRKPAPSTVKRSPLFEGIPHQTNPFDDLPQETPDSPSDSNMDTASTDPSLLFPTWVGHQTVDRQGKYLEICPILHSILDDDDLFSSFYQYCDAISYPEAIERFLNLPTDKRESILEQVKAVSSTSNPPKSVKFQPDSSKVLYTEEDVEEMKNSIAEGVKLEISKLTDEYQQREKTYETAIEKFKQAYDESQGRAQQAYAERQELSKQLAVTQELVKRMQAMFASQSLMPSPFASDQSKSSPTQGKGTGLNFDFSGLFQSPKPLNVQNLTPPIPGQRPNPNPPIPAPTTAHIPVPTPPIPPNPIPTSGSGSSPTINAGGITFNLGTTTHSSSLGYSRPSRIALLSNPEALIKIRENATKKILRTTISASRSVTNFDPNKMNQKDNFYHFVSDWRADCTQLIQHIDTYGLTDVFRLAKIVKIPVLDALGNQIVDPSTGQLQVTTSIAIGDNLLETWQNLSLEDVVSSCKIYAEHAEEIDRQSLAWSYDFILNNVDDTLRYLLLSECDAYPSHYGRSGPLAFFCMANRVISVTQNLSHNILSSLMVLELKHFPGEDVHECVFILRNILRFLNYGHPTQDITPPNMMRMLFEIFLHATNDQFVTYVQNLKDFNSHLVNDDPQKLFDLLQGYYNEINTNPMSRWLPTSKKRSTFIAQRLSRYQDDSSDDDDRPSILPSINQNSSSKEKPYVDRTPPGKDEPRTRVNERTGKEEHWCGRCYGGGRWGNHLSKDHDKWYKEFKQYKAEQKRKREERSDTSSQTSSQPKSDSSTNEQSSDPPQKTENESEPNDSVINQAPNSMRKVTFSTPLEVGRRRTYVSFQDSDDEDF